jgi:hypothetical protein
VRWIDDADMPLRDGCNAVLDFAPRGCKKTISGPERSRGRSETHMSSKPQKSFTDPARTTAIGMLRYAIEFYAAALAADRAIGDMGGYEITAPTPLNYLIGHAIELGLKPTIRAKRCDGPGRNAKR